MIGLFLVSTIQPIVIITIIIIIVLIYSYIIYISVMRYWFRYIFVIVILSGVLVIFTYMTRLIPNERFENYNLLYIFIFIIITIAVYEYTYREDTSLVSLNIWNIWFGNINIFILVVLLIIILMVVWFRYINEGSLRIN